MQVFCFEDSLVERLRPITLARPAYAITCASFRLVDWLGRLEGTLTAEVRDYLTTIQTLDFGLGTRPDLTDADGLLAINARLVPRVGLDVMLQDLASRDASCAIVDAEDNAVLAVRLTAADASPLSSLGADMSLAEAIRELARSLPAAGGADGKPFEFDAFRWPHHVIAAHMAEMPDALSWRIRHGDYRQLQDGLFVGPGVEIGDHASVQATEHPIVLEQNVKIGPFCFLEGPVYAGAGARITEHAAIKDGVSLGHTVKIGGEVEASVVEPLTNKQHHGFLGHSYLGSWINLGAGTCNSDLKNTYGKINVEYGHERIATGMQFLGCVMGDYSKTAINTGIFTGKVIGVCSMLYGFVTSNVSSYVNYARLFGQTSPLPPDVMVNTQQRMFSRRNVEQRECDRQLIVDMYARTADERELDQQLALS